MESTLAAFLGDIMEYSFKIRFIIDGKLHYETGGVTSQLNLVTANDIFQAIERSLPEDRKYETFSIMNFHKTN